MNRTIEDIQKDIELLGIKGGYDIEQLLTPQDCRRLSYEIERLNNIINTILEFDFFKNDCPLDFSYTEKCDEDEAQNVFYEDAYCEENCNNDYKKCWLKYFKGLQELKGDGSNENK